MKNYIWKSAFASLINQYIEMKHLAGLKFIDQEVHLQHFDHYLDYSGYEGTALTKDILFPFIYDQGESEYTMHTKENLFLDFSKYIVGKGHYAYTFAPIYKFHSNHYVPHIYTRDERKKFLQAVDNYPVRNCSNRHIMDPVFFRIIIGTGCRLSEVLHLKISDYDRSAGAIRVMHSKNYRSRIVLHISISETTFFWQVSHIREMAHAYTISGILWRLKTSADGRSKERTLPFCFLILPLTWDMWIQALHSIISG